jgi:hypothetical protein
MARARRQRDRPGQVPAWHLPAEETPRRRGSTASGTGSVNASEHNRKPHRLPATGAGAGKPPEIRSPKSECRRKSECPKPEISQDGSTAEHFFMRAPVYSFGLRISDFFRVSAIRISDFGLKHALMDANKKIRVFGTVPFACRSFVVESWLPRRVHPWFQPPFLGLCLTAPNRPAGFSPPDHPAAKYACKSLWCSHPDARATPESF